MWDREHDEQPLGLLRLQPLFCVECGGDLPLGDRLIGCSSSCQTHVEKAQVISRTFPLHDHLSAAVPYPHPHFTSASRQPLLYDPQSQARVTGTKGLAEASRISVSRFPASLHPTF